MTADDSAPPTIPGFSFVRRLGAGGFAEVHLFEQAMPRREVAVKVLSTRLRGAATVQAFEHEANLMATVSAHPSIVTVYEADISPDGRPYLVMEYCPRPTLQERTRGGRMSLADALGVGVHLAGAVETAHRAGILHRDIKPGNVLFTRYDHPALADFGIAGTITGDPSSEIGLSVPWSPPEAFDRGDADARLDVYSLGATLFAMLEGHAPFVVPGGSNGQRDQMQRIRTVPAPPLSRSDVPPSLRAAIARALEKDPARRQGSAIEFGHDLQRTQDELDMAHTPIVVPEIHDDAPRPSDDEGRTHVRGVVRIGSPPADEETRQRPAVIGEVPSTTPWPTAAQHEATAPLEPDTELRPVRAPLSQEPEAHPSAGRSAGRRALLLAVAGLAVAAVAIVLLLPRGARAPSTTGSGAEPADPVGASSEIVPAVAGLKGAVDGDRVRFTWTNPSPLSGDAYVYRAGGADDTGAVHRVTRTRVTVQKQHSDVTCIAVYLVRASGQSSDQPMRACVG